jgi:protein AATF/BFR2
MASRSIRKRIKESIRQAPAEVDPEREDLGFDAAWRQGADESDSEHDQIFQPNEVSSLRARAIGVDDDVFATGKYAGVPRQAGAADSDDAESADEEMQRALEERLMATYAEESDAPDSGAGTNDESSDSDAGDMDAMDEELDALAREDSLRLMRSSEAREQDAARSTAVRSQLKCWERCLEARIRTQKPLMFANQLPGPYARAALIEAHPGVGDAMGEVASVVRALLLKCAVARHKLARTMPTDDGATKRDESVVDAVSPAVLVGQKRKQSDMEGAAPEALEGVPVGTVWKGLHRGTHGVLRHALGVFDGWFDRVHLLSGVSAKRARKLQAVQKPPSKQFASILKHKAAVVQRAQCRSGSVRVLGEHRSGATTIGAAAAAQEGSAGGGIPGTYDDMDYYSDLLKAFISTAKGSEGVADLVASKRKRVRKSVDRKASKGRKMRFHVHDALVNFMEPRPLPPTDVDIDTLFSSIFRSHK